MADTGGVSLHAVAKRYGMRGPWVLREVDHELAPGTIVHIAGPNGAGKSTLLRILAGVTPPTRGRRAASPATTVGYAPQQPPAPAFTADGFLEHHLRLRGLADERGRDELDRLTDGLGLRPLLHQRLPTLSTGSLHKVVTVQALLGRAGLIVLDEPFASLDAAARDALWAILRRRAAEGSIVVFSDHLQARWPQVDESLVLDEGRLSAQRGQHARAAAPLTVCVPAEESDRELARLIAGGWHIRAVDETADGAVSIVAER